MKPELRENNLKLFSIEFIKRIIEKKKKRDDIYVFLNKEKSMFVL